ncbi:MAG TPA: DAK2 domain-containing protein [Candidatus Faecousia excrementigallinarum]|uniref:DAK2 domain-containing protein n=1 Tax=Candidatus Faecousia excrementigallinarum TaxID=2840806 RepID=A0A9D0Z600_9FIRM|nr:DAK2 domain-containing protein [Candidatus Faecousia excrementigallinarum]
MREIINGSDFRRMLISAAASIEIHKQQLNELNVFPVPDGDTGTNMSMTISAAAAELRKTEDPSLEKASSVTASAMLRGARGNSGVILSLLMRGMAKALKGHEECDGTLWAHALQEGVDAAYKAIMKPTEGTILTVARLAASKAATAARENNYLEFVHEAAIAEAKVALADTVNQNPVLKKAGVVDAGGKGWLFALEAMLSALRGEDIAAPEGTVEVKEQADFSDFADEDITFTYCTEFIVSREGDSDPEDLRAFLNELGDSLVLVDDDEIIKVHVHTNDPGAALHEAVKYGSFVTVKIENMRLQHTEKVMSEQELAPKIAEPEKPIGVVSVCAGSGLADVFSNLGVDGIISGGQTMNPSTQDILEAVNKVPAETVLVLPNNKNIIMAAQQVDELTPKHVVVIPSKTVPQGVTAMLNFNPEGTVEENTEAMTESLSTVDTMQITYAARNSDFDGHDIHEGDYLAIYGSSLFGTSQDIKVLLRALAEKVRDSGKEFITIYYGEDIKEKHAQKTADLFSNICPNADVNLLRGGQPVYYYMISAE